LTIAGRERTRTRSRPEARISTLTARRTAKPAQSRAPQDPDRTLAPDLELIGGEHDDPVLAHWQGNVGAPLALDLAPPLEGEVRHIDLLSWNIAVGTGRLPELVARLRAGEFGGAGNDPSRPLVILAQEAYRADETVPERPTGPYTGGLIVHGGQTGIAQMAAQAGLSMRYAPSMRNGAERSDRGNAILSTVAIHRSHAFALPYVNQRRVSVAAELVGLDDLTFVSTHLDTWGRPPTGRGLFWNFGSGRAAQAGELAKRIIRQDGYGGVIVGGDFNTPLGSGDPAVKAVLRAGFTEATKVGTWSHTFNGPIRFLLDHVLFHSFHGRIRAIQVTRLDEDASDRGRVFGSDHHPLLARVTLAPGQGRPE
jgi:endonuclease/exonuclease/phosphatase family metal-dependent hydrolase